MGKSSEIFHKKLKAAFERHGSIADFCRKSGISRAAVQNWTEKGQSPVLDRLDIIADALGLRPEELISEAAPKKSHSLSECIDAVRAATGGQELIPAELLAEIATLSPKQKTAVFDAIKATIRGESKPAELTPEEKELLDLFKTASASNRKSIVSQLRVLTRNEKKNLRTNGN